jgi:hypothetical protein
MKYVFHFSFVGLASTTVVLLVLLLLLASGSLLLPDSKAQMQQQAQSIISSHFSTSGTAKQVVDAYKAGLKFKDYIAASLKNRESPEHTIIKNQLGSGNTMCGGSDAITKPTQCDSVISFAKSACENDLSISPNCTHGYIDTYISQRNLDVQAINKNAYKQLAQIMVDLHPEAQGNDAIFELR